MAVIDHNWESVICGHHVYKGIWTPNIGEILECRQEEDLYVIRVIKDDVHHYIYVVNIISTHLAFALWYSRFQALSHSSSLFHLNTP